MPKNVHAAKLAVIEASEEYRARIEAAFGEAVPAEYDENGQCTLCAEEEGGRCPGWHSPATHEED